MPLATAQPARNPSPDELDNLFNYDAGLEEALRNTGAQAEDAQPDTHSGANLPTANFDEEVKITRKRQPIAKLDQERLLSKSGVPKLQRISKSLRFKGKGHEFSDMTRLLNTYQLWLDDLYPRAKFADGLTILEKLGHKKTMHMYRRQWIEEGKPKPVGEPEEVDLTGQGDGQDKTLDADSERAQVTPARNGQSTRPLADQRLVTSSGQIRPEPPAEDEPEEDELDALLAESAPAPVIRASLFGSGSPSHARADPPDKNDFADEEEAMMAMEF